MNIKFYIKYGTHAVAFILNVDPAVIICSLMPVAAKLSHADIQ